MKNLLFFIAVFQITFASAQQDTTKNAKVRLREYKRFMQISLFPGTSTNGISSGFYFNKISLNLISGSSAGTNFIEIGGITNHNYRQSNGIQIAGLSNLIGTNAFVNLTLSEERWLIHNDFRCTFQGIQLAGLLNYVMDEAGGIQLSGGLNVVGRSFEGVQLAGIGNSAGGTSSGFHMAGLYNVVHESVAGIQVAGVFNYTGEELMGIQLALINKARNIKGKRSSPPERHTGLQIGLLNFSKAMDGLQIGLINFGGALRGKQIGLINFFHRLPSKDPVRMGTPIGLLNFGSYGSYLRLYYNEIFSANIEYTTGNCVNCTWTQSTMPYWDANKRQNQNVLMLGYDQSKNIWGFGYGFQKVLYSKSSMNPKDKNNNKRLITYGVRLMHLNRDQKLDKSFNLLTRLNFDWGKFKWGKAYRSYYWFVGGSLNYFMFDGGQGEPEYHVRSVEISSPAPFGMKAKCWPGYNVGIQF